MGKTPDNNKRLALLESGVSAIAIALTANGFTVGEGEDPLAAAIAAVKGQAATIDDLTKKLEAAEGGNATDGEIAAIARADKADAELGELQAKVQAVVDYLCANYPDDVSPEECALSAATRILGEQKLELEQLNIDVEQLEAQLEAKQNAGESELEPTVARERPENARDFGPTFCKLDRADLVELLAADAGLEIAFSNGEYELVGLEPIAIKGSDLVSVEGRYIAPVVFVRGGADREDIHGAVLVHGGEQIDYFAFPRPIELEAKQERRFEKAIIFG
jgi:hypothetical protein